MAFMFEHSCLASKPEVDLFTNLPTQAAVEDGFHVEHLPTTNVNDNSPIKFHVSGDSNHYTDLSKSYLYLEGKIVKADGTDLEDDDVVGPINLIGQTLFQQVDISLNDVLVSDASNLYHYRALIETLLSYSSEAKTSQLSMGLYYKDKATVMDDIADANTGLVSRRKFMANSKVVPLIGKIHSDMFCQHRYLLNGVDLKIKLLRNTDKFVLMGPADSSYKFKILHASFFVRKVKLNNGIQLKHIEKLEKQLQPARYPLRRVNMKSCNLATGSLSWNEENLFSGILPKRIVVGMVDAVSYEGAYNKNPFNFKHNNLKYCSLLLDGKMIPQKPIVCDFEKGNTLRNYFTLLESTGKVFVDDGLDIDRTEYENGYSLIAFDLTPDLSENGCYHLIKKGNIRLELKFDEALEQPVNLIIYSEFDSSISIDKNRAVITNFYT
jgi:hypothetical protein